jgi:WXG100 family type VII secretion target
VSGQLENDWQGQSRYRFDQLYQDWRTSTEGITQIGEDLGRHLQNTADQFEQADRSL